MISAILAYFRFEMFYLGSGSKHCCLSVLLPSKCESISPLDDLAFDMYQDPEVAHIIRLLDQKKQDMVRQEKYEQAKHLKQAIADLQKVASCVIMCNISKVDSYNTLSYLCLGFSSMRYKHWVVFSLQWAFQPSLILCEAFFNFYY